MDGRTDSRQIDRQTYGQRNIDKQTDGWTDKQTEVQTSGWTDKHTEEQADRQTDKTKLVGAFSVGAVSDIDLNKLIEESLRMAKFKHPNVMTLIGVSIDCGPSPYIVMPYMKKGDLLSYLRDNQAKLTIATEADPELVRPNHTLQLQHNTMIVVS